MQINQTPSSCFRVVVVVKVQRKFKIAVNLDSRGGGRGVTHAATTSSFFPACRPHPRPALLYQLPPHPTLVCVCAGFVFMTTPVIHCHCRAAVVNTAEVHYTNCCCCLLPGSRLCLQSEFFCFFFLIFFYVHFSGRCRLMCALSPTLRM